MLATGAGSITEIDAETVKVGKERLEMDLTMGTERGFDHTRSGKIMNAARSQLPPAFGGAY